LSHLNFNQRIEVLSKRAYTNRHDQYFNQKEVGTEQEEQNRNCSQGRRDEGKRKGEIRNKHAQNQGTHVLAILSGHG
jgi:hypothetical protein